MRTINLVLFLGIFFIISFQLSCKHKETNPYEKMEIFNWLEGHWEFEVDNGLFGEVWSKSNDSVFSGHGYMLIGEDTVSKELLRLEFRKGEIFYIVTIEDHNDGKPVNFKLTSDQNNTYVFENPEHDFPKKIIYKKNSENSVTAIIEGDEADEMNRMEFFYSRAE